jgi:Family of unknown function (DUF5335)
METRTVAAPQWKATFDSLSRIYDGSTASLEIINPDLGAQYVVENQPFRGISSDPDGVELMFGTTGTAHLAHRIANPSQVQLEIDDAGLLTALAIDSDDARAVVRFRSPVGSHLLNP